MAKHVQKQAQGSKTRGLALAMSLLGGLACGAAGLAEARWGTLSLLAGEAGPARHGLRAAGELDIARNLRALDMAGRLQTLSQTMTVRSLLAALVIDKAANVAALDREHASFARIIAGLRRGDAELGLARAEHPEILRKLARLEKEWSIFGPVVRKIVKNGEVSPRNVAIVAECIKPLAEGTRELIEVVQYYATGGQTFSVMTSMIGAGEAQHALISEMAAGYLLVAYGHKPKAYRAKLQDQVTVFDQTLRGLIHGDGSRKLLAAPTPALDGRLRDALELWQGQQAALHAVAAGGEVDRDSIPDFMRRNAALAAEIGKAVELYKSI